MKSEIQRQDLGSLRLLSVFIGLMVIGLPPQTMSTAQGQVNWNNSGGGNFSTGGNWSGGLVPNSTQDVRFALNSAYTVTFTQSQANQAMLLEAGHVNLLLGGHTYAANARVFGGDLRVFDGTWLGSLVIGGNGSNGTVTVGAGGQAIGTAFVGAGNQGTFVVQDGGSYQGDLNIGNGAVSVTGLGSTIRTGFADIGNVTGGIASLNVTSGATFESTGLIQIASQNNSSGTLSVNQAILNAGGINLGNGAGSFIVNGVSGRANLLGNINASASDSILISNGGQLEVLGAGLGNQVFLGSGANLTVVSNGSLKISSTGTGSGLNLAAGSTLILGTSGAGPGTISTTGFTRSGTLTHNVGTFSVDGGQFDNSGAILNLGGVGDVVFQLQNGGSTSNLTGITVGATNTAFTRALNVLSGSSLTTTGGSVIGQLGSGSLVRVSDAGSRWTSGGGVSVGQAVGSLVIEKGGTVSLGTNSLSTGVLGAGSTGNLTIQSGGRLDAGSVELSRVVGSTSLTTVSGTGSQLNAAGIFIGGSTNGVGGSAVMTIADGATVVATGTTRIRTAGTLNLNGGTLTTVNFTRDATGVLNFGGGTMRVLGTYSNSTGTVTLAGTGIDDNPTLVMDGSANSAGITAINIGSSNRLGTLTLNPGSQLTTGTATIASRGTVNLNGGTLLASAIANGGTMNWNSGAVKFTANASLDSSTLTGLLGSSHNLRENQTLGAISGTLTIGSTLNINGGTLAPVNLTNNSTLNINQGGVVATGSFVNNAGRTVQVNGSSELSASNDLNNNGVIRLNSATASISGGALFNNTGATLSGTGRIDSQIVNNGTIRSTGSDHLVFTGASNRNFMNINLAGGTIEFTESVANLATGAIVGRGTFVSSSNNPGGPGLINEGLMSFSSGTTDIYGDVEITDGGRVVTGGGGVTTFFDDVVHNGTEIRTFLGSRTVFFGDQSGGGNFTGTGVVEYAGDLRPGNSPASILYEGDVLFNSSVHSYFEIGGIAIGTFDRLLIAGDWQLDGSLFVNLIDGYKLGRNEQYLIGEVGGILTGQFHGLGEGSRVGNYGGRDLFITYRAGNGNDVALFTAAVPEPGTALLAVMCLVGGAFRRCRRLDKAVAAQL